LTLTPLIQKYNKKKNSDSNVIKLLKNNSDYILCKKLSLSFLLKDSNSIVKIVISMNLNHHEKVLIATQKSFCHIGLEFSRLKIHK